MTRANMLLIKWKVCDADGTLSLSNVTLMVLIVKLALTPALDWVTMTAFFLTLLNHNARKFFAKDKVAKVVADQDKLTALSNEVRALANAATFRNLGK